ncbi:MAG TPA: hypothetical protein V6D22_02095 [Candidatus Obscuribacterales bacterium]
MRFNRKKQQGGTLAFAVVLILVLILIGVGFFALSLYFGGAQETKDATNAGALNTAKQALTINCTLSGDPNQQFFKDVVDSGGQVNLVNINRVWAKALFVAVNAEAAKNDGGHDGSGGSSASAAHDAAMAISDALAKQLNTATNLYPFFDQYAQQNSVRMLGLGAQVQHNPTKDWVNSYLERNYESNVQFANNLPSAFTNTSIFTGTKRTPPPGDAAGKQWLVGYSPLHVMDQDFWQVAYPFEQKPHIVDRTFFTQHDQTPLTVGAASWATPVPNAFGVAGTTQKTSSGYNETAVSWVETNPQKTFPMQFPNGFIRIVIHPNQLKWYLIVPEGLEVSPGTNYKSQGGDGTYYSIPLPALGCGTIRGEASSVGNEYLTGTLLNAIFALPSTTNTMDYLAQRVQEMLPGLSKSQAEALLTAQLTATSIDTSSTSDQVFYIYPKSGVPNMIDVQPDSSASLPDGCNKSATPDGTEQTIETEGAPGTPAGIPLIVFGDTINEYETCPLEGMLDQLIPDVAQAFGYANRNWVPGTGWNGGCLGELRIQRWTDAVLQEMPCACPL